MENYKSERQAFATKEEALKAFKENKYKVELIEGLTPRESSALIAKANFSTSAAAPPHLYSLGKSKPLKY